ncbi:MAG: hypothetical protein WDW36_005299 [Sanguina aurantia]
MSCHEVITLQFGSYANHVGAHFWNLQDELMGYSQNEAWSEYAAVVDPGALYSSTEDKHGNMTYRPRAAIFDLCGGLGGVSFSPDATHGPDPSMLPSWGGAVEVHQRAPIPKSSFTLQLEEQEESWDHEGKSREAYSESPAFQAQQAEALEAAARELGNGAGVGSWTDYLKATLDARTVHTLPGLWSGVHEFSSYGDGLSAAAGVESRDALMERVRVLAEASDALQGFQVFADDQTGWGALSAELLAEVREEYSGRPVLYWAVRQPQAMPAQGVGMMVRTRVAANLGMATARLHEVSSLLIPLAVPMQSSALPALQYTYFNPYHTSAILASVIDSATTMWRATPGCRTPLGEIHGAANLHSLVALMTGGGGAHFAAARALLPCPSLPGDPQHTQAQTDARRRHPAASAARDGTPRADGGDGAAGTSLDGMTAMAALTPGVADDPMQCLAESITLRGARCGEGPASTTSSLQALDSFLLRLQPRRCVQHRCVVPLPLALPLPYPRIFSRCISTHGDFLSDPRIPRSGRPSSSSSTPSATPSDADGGPGPKASSSQSSDPGNWKRQGMSSEDAAEGAVHDVVSTPMLTKLTATRCFQPMLQGVVQQWSKLCVTAAGRALLGGWDLSDGDAGEVTEDLKSLVATYNDGTDSD